MLSDVDPTFAKVNKGLFSSEFRALALEVFGVAWFHSVKDKFAIYQSMFTKHYLEERGLKEIWESLHAYNLAIARAAILGLDSSTAMGRFTITSVNLMRTGFADAYLKTASETERGSSDIEAVGRVANRFGSHAAWERRHAHFRLAITLLDRLAFEPNETVNGMTMAIIQTLYEGASQAIRRVKIVA